jgi:endonuclease/exonuclease/phosphatase (EEP) superfamily protein YafD
MKIGLLNRGMIITAVICLYVLTLIIWGIGKVLFGDQSLYVLALNYLGVWLFAPLLFFIPWVVLNRNNLDAILLIVPALLFLGFYGARFIPKIPYSGDSEISVKVMTFNLQLSNGDTDSIIAMIDSHQPEILALQELAMVHEANLASILSERYNYQIHYQPAGLAIYSQHPILRQEILPSKPWPIQSAIIRVDEISFQLINGHLANPGIIQFLETREINHVRDSAAARIAQVNQINQAMSSTSLPVIVACDGNMTDLTSAYAQMTENLKDAYKVRGWGLGHTFLIPRGFEIHTKFNLPFQRIDYLFYSPDISVISVKVIKEDTGSDHRPLWAQFDLGKSTVTNQ